MRATRSQSCESAVRPATPDPFCAARAVTGTHHLSDDLAGHEALSQRSLAATLSRLVATESVNPGVFERAMAQQVRRELDGIGCAVTVVEFEPGRPSVAAVLGSRVNGPSLLLNGHMDTVPVGDRALWLDDPFAGAIRDGAVWGRGALDMKGGLAAQVACARVLAAHHQRLRGRLVLHFAAGEECGEQPLAERHARKRAGDIAIR